MKNRQQMKDDNTKSFWDYLKSIFSCYIKIIKYSSVSFCCCFLGMVLMFVVLVIYYSLFIAFTPNVATEAPVVKPEHGKSFDTFYPKINREEDILDGFELLKDDKQTGYRKRRTPPPTTPTSESSSSNLPSSAMNQATDSSGSKSTKSRSHHHETTTTESPDTIPDFQLSNHLVDSVFSAAEAAGMKEPLGLCRKHADVKIPEVKATLFPQEQAGDILNCINDLLRNQTRKQICLHLDPEMNAYLKWLLMTGESRERHKPIKLGSKEDFLFPSTCPSSPENETPSATTQCFAEPGDRAEFDHR